MIPDFTEPNICFIRHSVQRISHIVDDLWCQILKGMLVWNIIFCPLREYYLTSQGQKLRKKFPDSMLIISTLFPRGEESLSEIVSDLNNYITNGLNKTFSNINIMNNMAISKNMLCDNKHLDLKKNGFYIFLANIKFLLYGHIPFLNIHQTQRNIYNNWKKNNKSMKNRRYEN